MKRAAIRYERDDDEPQGGGAGGRSPSPQHKRRAVASTVSAVPTIETKSRAAEIADLKRVEKKEDVVRTRRLLGSLLVGTLNQFQREEKGAKDRAHVQMEKQREIERRMAETDRANRERLVRERQEALALRRKKEELFHRMQRKKAIRQYGEEKEKHFRRLQCFIQTQTKPPLFYLPAKHTLRTLELLKDSWKKIETLIDLRREEMQRELQRIGAADNTDDDGEEGLAAEGGKVKSVVVAPVSQASSKVSLEGTRQKKTASAAANDDSTANRRRRHDSASRREEGEESSGGEEPLDDDDGGITLDEQAAVKDAEKATKRTVVVTVAQQEAATGQNGASDKAATEHGPAIAKAVD